MIAKHVKDYGKLRVGDIMQYLTVPEVKDITGDAELTYKTFFLKGNPKTGARPKKIVLDPTMPDTMSHDDMLNASYDVKNEEEKKKMTIAKVNPPLFRELQYLVTIHPDVLNPKSEDLERAWATEEFDRMVVAPPGMFDPEETAKLLLGANPTTKKDVDKYLAKQPAPGAPQPMQPGGMPNAGNSPLNAMGKKSPLPGLSTPSPAPALAGLGGQ